MGRSQETYNKKEIRNKKEKKRKEKAEKRLARKDSDKQNQDDMIAYVDENGVITNTPPDPSKKKTIKAENIEITVPKKEDIETMDKVRKGVVTFFNNEKGYGFIKDSETKESIFVHINNTIDEIKENNIVKFEVEMGMKGLTAIKVEKLKV